MLLEQWGLAEKRKASFSALSGGQRQRLFIALALVNNPKIVFLDEMTTGLDPAARRVAWELIRSIRERGTTVVLVTHFMEEAEKLCDRVAIVDRGRLVATDSPQGLVAALAGDVRVVFTTGETDLAWLEQVSHVKSVSRNGPRVEVAGSGPGAGDGGGGAGGAWHRPGRPAPGAAQPGRRLFKYDESERPGLERR